MISKNIIKLVKSLTQKKYRLKENLFLAEGNKLVNEVLQSEFHIRLLVCTEEFIKSAHVNTVKQPETLIATQEGIKKCSLLKNPQQALALCKIPDRQLTDAVIKNNLTLCLDGIQDPGNMGTILRIADWFGIQNILASPNTVDIFNPKVVQASMGAVLRVRVFYTALDKVLDDAENADIPVYGTFLSGFNIYSEKLPDTAMIVMGNEGQGISDQLAGKINYKIHIPSYNSNPDQNSESLNVSAATAIICSEFRRNKPGNYSK